MASVLGHVEARSVMPTDGRRVKNIRDIKFPPGSNPLAIHRSPSFPASRFYVVFSTGSVSFERELSITDNHLMCADVIW